MSKPKAADLALKAFNYLGTGYSVLDCQAFVEKCMKAVGISKDLTGSNAWYRAMTWVGTPEECLARFGIIPVGAILYILEFDGKEPEKYRRDGIGNASHMGIKTGTSQGAIHSSETRGGVCESYFADKTIRNGGWNQVGLWDAFDYGEKINQVLSSGGEAPAMETAKVVWAADGDTVFLRPSKSKSAPYIVRIPVGEKVHVLSTSGDWSSITWQGYSGWMMSQFLKNPEECESDPGNESNPSGSATESPAVTDKVVITLPYQAAAQLLPALQVLMEQLESGAGYG